MRLLSSSEDYTSRRFAEVIVDFMDSFHIRQANLVGTDMKAETLARIVVTTVQGAALVAKLPQNQRMVKEVIMGLVQLLTE